MELKEPNIKTPLEIQELKEKAVSGEHNHNDTPIEMTDVWQVYGRYMAESKTPFEVEEMKNVAENKEGNKKVTFRIEETKEMVESKEQNNGMPPSEIKEEEEIAESMEQKALVPQKWEGIKTTWAVKKSVPFLVPGLA